MLNRRSVLAGAIATLAAEEAGAVCTALNPIGPIATGTLATVTFSPNANNQVVPPTVWGVATGLFINDWGSLTPAFFATAKQASIAPNGWIPLLRLNAASGAASQQGYLSGGVFVGNNTAAPNWSFIQPFVAAAPQFLPSTCLVTMGATINKAGGGSTWTTAQYQSIVTQTINWMVANAPGIDLWGFEIDNEADHTGANLHTATVVGTYFAAMVAGIAASNKPSVQAIGPVTSFANASYIQACANAGGLNVCCYHMYIDESVVSDAVMMSLNSELPATPASAGPWLNAVNARAALAGSTIASPATIPLMMGEFNFYGIEGISTQQSGFQGAVTVASMILNALNGDPRVDFGALWDLLADGDYGLVQSLSSTTLTPAGYIMAVGSQVMAGIRGQEVVVNPTTTLLGCLGVYNGQGSGSFGTMLFNASPTVPLGPGTLGLSKWPVNSSGNGVINTLTINQANPTGLIGSATVSAGLVTLTIPAASVVFLFTPALI